MTIKQRVYGCALLALFWGAAVENAAAEGQVSSPGAGEQTVIPAPVNVVQPAPLNVTGSPANKGRDPFIATPRKVFTPDYGKGMDACLLRGICKVGRMQVGIFSTAGKGGASSSAGAGERFQQVSIGEQIKFFSENVEYIFTVRELGARSAVLVGENNQVYKVYL